MMASPALASSSSALSALKSYWTMPYTMAPLCRPARLWPRVCMIGLVVAVDSDRVCPEILEPFSEKPESCPSDGRSLGDETEVPLCLCCLPTTSKKATGTRPRAVGIKGLQASYHSVSSSRLSTWKKSPLWKASSWPFLFCGS